MKMVTAKLKIVTLRVHITVHVINMVLMLMKYQCMEIGFIQQIMLSLFMKKNTQKDLHQTTLHDGSLHRQKVLQKKDIEKIRRSVRAYVYLVHSSQVPARSTVVGNSAPAMDAQRVLKSMFKAMISEDYSIGIDIEKSQGVLEHALP